MNQKKFDFLMSKLVGESLTLNQIRDLRDTFGPLFAIQHANIPMQTNTFISLELRKKGYCEVLWKRQEDIEFRLKALQEFIKKRAKGVELNKNNPRLLRLGPTDIAITELSNVYGMANELFEDILRNPKKRRDKK